MARQYSVTPRENIGLQTGDVVTFLDGPHKPLVLRNVTDVILRAHTIGKWLIEEGDAPDDESDEPCCIRVLDGCDRIQIIGLKGNGAYHGIRFTKSKNSKVLHCEMFGMVREGLLAGAVDNFELGFCEMHHNGKGNEDHAHGAYISWGTRSAQIHHLNAHHNTGSGLQLNGTAEIHGRDYDEHVWRTQLRDNGVEGTPNLSLMSCVQCRFRLVETSGGRGGVRIFKDPGGVPSYDNRFFGCNIDQDGTSFSVDCQSGTRLTRFDPSCSVTGPRQTEEGAERPQMNAMIT